MRKLVKESLYEDSQSFYSNTPFGNASGQADVDRENAGKAAIFDEQEFWDEVAEILGGEIVYFNVGEEDRKIEINMPNGDEAEILHNWRYDGSPTKPVTTINGSDLGRYSIWDNPKDVADDYSEHLNRNYREDEY